MPYDAVALGLVAAGLVCGLTVTLAARAPIQGLRTVLDFLLAAGLLRLSVTDSPTALAVAVATVVVRQIAGRGLHLSRPSRRARAADVPDGAA